MKKISWLKRIFMTWDSLEKYMLNAPEDDSALRELNKELKRTNDELRKDKEDLKIKVSEIEKQIQELIIKSDEKDKNISIKESEISNLKNQIQDINIRLEEKRNFSKNIQEEINNKLGTLGRIEKTFFATTGNKGKGELGELQVKTILQKSGLNTNFWQENLMVGTKTVEFAIKSGIENKWIPVDSKVLDAKYDEDKKIIIDNSYINNIKAQAKSITKYLNKKNTAGYGVMVLQSDNIQMELFDNHPELFQEVMRDYKIYIASPSSFVQMAWSISQIVSIYERVKKDEAIYEDMMLTLDNVAKFANNLHSVQKNFNTAMDTHFPAIEKKHINLSKRLEESGKLKQIKSNKKEEENE